MRKYFQDQERFLLAVFISAVFVGGVSPVFGADVPDSYPQVSASPENFSANIPKPEEFPIDLPMVLRLAGLNALDVRIAAERVNEARAQRLSADMQFLPAIRPAFENRWAYGRVQGTTGAFAQAHNKTSALEGVEASLDLHIGESLFASLAARRRVTASEAGLRAISDSAQLDAVTAYFSLVLARADQAIVEDRLKQADETIRLSQELLKGGTGLLSEVKRSEAARAEVEQRLAAAKEFVRNSSLALTDVLHIDPLVTLVPLQQPQEVLTLVPPERSLYDLVSDAVAYRPELAESRALWGALGREKTASIFGPLIPTVRADAAVASFGPHPDQGERAHDYFVGIGWKIGAGGIGDVSRLRIAESRVRQEAVRFAKIADQVMREVVTNQTHVESEKIQLELAKKEIAAAEEALRLSQERFKGGTALTLEVLSAEDVLFLAKSRAAQDIAEVNKGEYGLLRSIGGFQGLERSERTMEIGK